MAYQDSTRGPLGIEGHDMARRQVPVDWLDLEMAFETRLDDSASCLDLGKGEVHFVPTSPFGEDAAGDREDDLSEEAVDAGLEEGWLLPVEPLRHDNG